MYDGTGAVKERKDRMERGRVRPYHNVCAAVGVEGGRRLNTGRGYSIPLTQHPVAVDAR